MIGTLLRRHLLHQRVLIMFLIVGMTGFECLIINIGSAMDEGGGVADIIAKLPRFVQHFIQTQIGEISLPAFVAFGFEHPATMGGSLAYVVFVSTTPAGERDAGLLDLILARPLKRSHYLVATVLHLVATAVVLPCCLLIGTAIALAMVDTAKDIHWTNYVPAAVGLMSLLLAWGGIGLLLVSGGQRRGATVVQMVAAIVTMFLVHVLGQFSTAMDPLEWISPFHYYSPVRTTVQSESCVGGVTCLLAVFVVTTSAAFVRFQQRDI